MAKKKEKSNEDAVRRGMTNANLNEEAFKVVIVEILLLSALAGAYLNSWLLFGALFIGLGVAMYIPPLTKPLMVAFSVGWGAVGWVIGIAVGELGASIALAAICFLGALTANFQAIGYMKDINEDS